MISPAPREVVAVRYPWRMSRRVVLLALAIVAGEIVFEQPAHDFPKRVRYSLSRGGKLLARIDDGSDAGTSMEWTWSRCPR